ncbi:HupE/UreJ family protein [Massilia sp. PAMC28688]|uniref:HupE/UreJ family protein n=1 Tax=Massilia sp. PAMC28688 TaxID=2861283 RepID=UPI001C62C15F|nr:HupE/UreJ family protein [Massilia sp. PAMC28688]QYF91697.1 HupE/UreJ family protein [Massilia sp. PAMC28688]
MMARTFYPWLLSLLLFVCSAAQAHKPSDSYLALDVKGAQVTGQWDIALRDLDFALNLDQDGNGELTWDEIRRQHGAMAAYALARLQLSGGDAACAITPGEQLIDHHTDGAYTVLRFSAACPAPVAALGVSYRLFADLDPQHKGLVKLTSEGVTSTAIFGPDNALQTLSLKSASKWGQFADYVKEGVWHIWIGFDHILFLLSLLLPAVLLTRGSPHAQTFRDAFMDVLKVVTAFTIAHSITLTLASLQMVSLPSRWVESAIAASVVVAALNNIFPVFRGRRPLAAFIFGLIHGFGFASVLADLGLPQGALALSLFGFNVGVELGQLAIVAAFLPLAYLSRKTWFYGQLMTTGSAAIALIATVWLVERAFDLQLMPV